MGDIKIDVSFLLIGAWRCKVSIYFKKLVSVEGKQTKKTTGKAQRRAANDHGTRAVFSHIICPKWIFIIPIVLVDTVN